MAQVASKDGQKLACDSTRGRITSLDLNQSEGKSPSHFANRLLHYVVEPIATASWWAIAHAMLDGAAPYQLAADPNAAEILIAAAEATISIDY